MRYILTFLFGALVATLVLCAPSRSHYGWLAEDVKKQHGRFNVHIGYDPGQRQPFAYTGNPGLYRSVEAERANEDARFVWTADNREDAVECSEAVAVFLMEWKPKRLRESP